MQIAKSYIKKNKKEQYFLEDCMYKNPSMVGTTDGTGSSGHLSLYSFYTSHFQFYNNSIKKERKTTAMLHEDSYLWELLYRMGSRLLLDSRADHLYSHQKVPAMIPEVILRHAAPHKWGVRKNVILIIFITVKQFLYETQPFKITL